MGGKDGGAERRSAEPSHPRFEIFRNGCCEPEGLFCDGMEEMQSIGVEQQSLRGEGLVEFSAAVNGVAKNRTSDVFEMDPDLVGASCFGTDHS